MKKLPRIGFVLFFCFLVTSCRGQVETTPPMENIPQEKESIPQEKEKAPDFDPYFNGNDLLASPFGPTTITRNILQDKTGNIWFATWEGIVRYDGKSFTNLTNKEGLRRARAFCILEDKTDIVWLGSIGGGLFRYDGAAAQQGESGFTNFTTEDGLVNNDVQCLYEDRKGNLWIGTRNGISVYNGVTFRNFTKADGLPSADMNAFVEDDSGKLWLGARERAYTFDGKSFTELTREEGQFFINVRTIIKDQGGNIWLGGQDGLWRYDGQSFFHYGPDFVGNLFEDQAGKLWVTKSTPSNTYEMGLYQFQEEGLPLPTASAKQIANPPGQVFGMTEDSNGNIWFGTERGACRYDGTTFEYFREEEGKK